MINLENLNQRLHLLISEQRLTIFELGNIAHPLEKTDAMRIFVQ